MEQALPLSVALSRALMAFEADYDARRRTESGLPTLPYYANLLRVLGTEPVPEADLPARSSVTGRAIRVALAKCDRVGWVDIGPLSSYKSRRQVSLTSSGIHVRDAAQQLIEQTLQHWAGRFGSDQVRLLCNHLQALVSRFELELPHYPSGYGQGDPRATGGGWLPAEDGPPAVPPRGAEWPVVPRKSRSVELPLSALLSQTLMAFTIDYEWSGDGWHCYDANVLQHVPDHGAPLDAITPDADLSGTGRSTLERHRMLYVEPDPDRPRKKRVRLRSRGKAMRDGYRVRLQETEGAWRERFGDKTVAELHKVLLTVVNCIDGDWLDHPPVTRWLSRKYKPNG